MFRPLALYIGWRYTKAKRRNHFISFISFASILGIALGVTVLITVLSVMNGFDEQIEKQIFSSAAHISVASFEGSLTNWSDLRQRLDNIDQVTASSPIVSTQAMLSHAGQATGVMIQGIQPKAERQVTSFADHMVAGTMEGLNKQPFGIVIGQGLADHLGVWTGDKVMVLTPKVDASPLGVTPRYRVFHVVGVFKMNSGFGYDDQMAFIRLGDGQKLLRLGQGVSKINLRVKRLFDAPQIADRIQSQLGGHYWVSDWTQRFGALFKAISMEKTMMFIILLLLVAIAAFNLVSTLVMVVTDKACEIAILRTLGSSPATVMAIFMVQGLTIGVLGTLLGVLGGVLLALNVTAVVSGLESVLGVQFISSQVYFINYLPSQLQWGDVFWIAGAAVSLSLIATLYPAWRAAKTNPAEALRYE